MDSVVEACKRVVTREEWGARLAKDRSDMATPVPFVILHHTYMPECFTFDECCKMMRSIQDFHMDVRGWDDIAYSFLVGEGSLVYRGRGWDTVGSHAPWYNFRSNRYMMWMIVTRVLGDGDRAIYQGEFLQTKLPTKRGQWEVVDEIINCAIEK
nr:peptidoglycan-recognition protein LB-like [Lytechinus pictus]